MGDGRIYADGKAGDLKIPVATLTDSLIERGLTAEYATTKVPLPRSKKPLVLQSDGKYDKSKWDDAMHEGGPSARLGDQVPGKSEDYHNYFYLFSGIVQHELYHAGQIALLKKAHNCADNRKLSPA